MIGLLAHHLETQHIPVLIGLFAAGIWIGWSVTSQLTARAARPTAVDESKGRPA